MRDLNELFTRCCEELDIIGVPYAKGKIDAVRINGRFSRCFGTCRKDPISGHYEINIAKFLLSDKITDDKVVRATIYHELIHSCPKCMNHGSEFQKWAELVSDCYDVDIQTYVSENRMKKVREAGVLKDKRKYEIVCCGCGTKSYAKRRTKIIDIIIGKLDGEVRCKRCGCNDFVVHKRL